MFFSTTIIDKHNNISSLKNYQKKAKKKKFNIYVVYPNKIEIHSTK